MELMIPKSANCWMLLVNDLCRQGVVERRLKLNSGGQQKRDFVAIDQVCSVLEHLLTMSIQKPFNRVFNLGGQNSLTVFQMATLISERFKVITGFKPPIEKPSLEVSDAVEPLDFSIHRLVNSGYTAPPKLIFQQEIDALIQFCLREF